VNGRHFQAHTGRSSHFRLFAVPGRQRPSPACRGHDVSVNMSSNMVWIFRASPLEALRPGAVSLGTLP
jgi:hypothetical protein